MNPFSDDKLVQFLQKETPSARDEFKVALKAKLLEEFFTEEKLEERQSFGFFQFSNWINWKAAAFPLTAVFFFWAYSIGLPGLGTEVLPTDQPIFSIHSDSTHTFDWIDDPETFFEDSEDELVLFGVWDNVDEIVEHSIESETLLEL